MKDNLLIFDSDRLKTLNKIQSIRNYIFLSLNNYEKVFFSPDSQEIDSFIQKIQFMIDLFRKNQTDFKYLVIEMKHLE